MGALKIAGVLPTFAVRPRLQSPSDALVCAMLQVAATTALARPYASTSIYRLSIDPQHHHEHLQGPMATDLIIIECKMQCKTQDGR